MTAYASVDSDTSGPVVPAAEPSETILGTVAPWQRFTKTHRCRVCGGYAELPPGKKMRCFGFISEDQTRAHCTREEHAGGLSLNDSSGTFEHHLHGACACGQAHDVMPPDPAPGLMATAFQDFHPEAPTETYEYCDGEGVVLFQVRRYDDAGGNKTFRQYRADGTGGWLPGVQGIDPFPYRLPQLLEAVEQGHAIFLCEGEKDVHAIEKAGGVATCNPGGALKWRQAFSDAYLKGANLVIVQDKDPKGYEHARRVIACSSAAQSVRLVEAKVGNDAWDHLHAGYVLEDLVEVPLDCDPNRFALTDLGNAERFVRDHGGDLRFVVAWKNWILYDPDEPRWRPDTRNATKQLAKETVRKIYGEVQDEDSEEFRKAIAKHATQSESGPRIKAMLELAEGQRGYVIEPIELDRDDHLLNLANGTLNLVTGELQPPRREDFITKLAPVTWTLTAQSPTWENFLGTVLPDADMRAFFQRAVGYSLSGDMQAHALFFVFGPTASGKSTAMGAIKTALGDYATSSNTDVFLAKRFEGGNTPELAKLPGVRMILMSELPPNKSFNAPLVKQWTGGDEIQATAKYQAPFEFKPKGKLWFTGNDRPHVALEDQAFWRRVFMIPFDVSIPKEAQDPELHAKLREPAVQSAILAWAYAGLLAFQEQGLKPPPAVQAAVEDYQDEVDPLQDFIEERCLLDPDAVTPASELHAAHVKHAKEAGTKPVGKTRFGKLLHVRGLTRTKVGGQRAWEGIGLKSAECHGWSPPGEEASGIPF